MKKQFLTRMITCILAIVMLVSSLVTDMTTAHADETMQNTEAVNLPVYCEDEQVTSLVLPQLERKVLYVTGLSENAEYQWYIQIPGTGEWARAYDKTQAECLISYAFLGNMVDTNGKAYLYCTAVDNGINYASDPVTVQISYDTLHGSLPGSIVTGISMENSVMSADYTVNAVAMYANARASEYVTVTINYVEYNEEDPDDKVPVFDSYVAYLQYGTEFHADVPSPTIPGFTPVLKNGDGTFTNASTVYLNYDNIMEDIVIEVFYKAIKVPYKVRYFLQNTTDDLYTEATNLAVDAEGYTGDYPDDELVRQKIDGFSPLFYEPEKIAADGSTVFHCYYERNYYLVYFDLDEGYGVEPIYARYGTHFVVNDPIKPGYIFKGWDLQVDVVYDGNKDILPEKIPSRNLNYKAIWDTTGTYYTVVYWKENANDYGYSYWGSEKIAAESAEIVDGLPFVSGGTHVADSLDIATIESEIEYFTFNNAKSEKDVLVEGDESTVVNVYYTRNMYTLTFEATGLCGVETHTHSDSCKEYICDVEHIHTDVCLVCELEVHEHGETCCSLEAHEHGADCCSKAEHTHSDACVDSCTHISHELACWGLEESDAVSEKPDGITESNPVSGTVYTYTEYYGYVTRYYLYYNGKWYRHPAYIGDATTKIELSCTHTHSAECYCDLAEHTHGTNCNGDKCGKTEHIHGTNCNGDKCGKIEHTHVDICYNCSYEAHTHTENCLSTDYRCGKLDHTHDNNCTNSNRTNTVYQVTGKYQADIHTLFPLKSTTVNNTTADYTGYWWQVPSGCETFVAGKYIVSIDTIPGENITFTGSYKGDDAKIYYYLEVLDEEDCTHEYNGKHYYLHKTVITVDSGNLTEEEEFHAINGFSKGDYNPSNIFSNTQPENWLYYTRNPYTLKFYNYNAAYGETKTLEYQEPWAAYKMGTPSYPNGLEPNAYEFAGWYTTGGCFDGTEVKWDTMVMPANDVTLYAKWAPTTHNVRFYYDYNKVGTEEVYAQDVVNHGEVINPVPKDPGPVSNKYSFVGWFYMEDGVKKAFYPHEMAVLKDLDLFAEWSSSVVVEYTVYFKDRETDTEIAAPLSGKIFAGQTKTFTAKAGTELYTGYQAGYFPETNSHSILMQEGENTFTFYYVKKDNVPYTVKYLDKQTGLPVAAEKPVDPNAAAVVTEKFVPVTGMIPDAYYKRLVLSANAAENVLIFYYVDDISHAYYAVHHMIENEAGDGYTEYATIQAIGDLNVTITQDPLTITGFTYDRDQTIEGNKSQTGVTVLEDDEGVSGTVVLAGLEMYLYYSRNTYSYTVKYLAYGTDEVLHEEKTVGNNPYGAIVEESYVPITGYTLVNPENTTQKLEIREDADGTVNVITFYYTEKQYTIRYIPVCTELMDNFGKVSPSMELGKSSSTRLGSTPRAEDGFEFAGWYTDAGCTIPVTDTDGAVSSTDNKFTPAKWADVTYYALFTPVVTSLTIEKTGVDADDQNQSFLFDVKGKTGLAADINLTVAIQGNGTVTIGKLPIGEYTVTELTSWSWRYTVSDSDTQTIEASKTGPNKVTFKNTVNTKAWLGDEISRSNKFEAYTAQ